MELHCVGTKQTVSRYLQNNALHVLNKYSTTGDSGETYDNVPKDRRQLGLESPLGFMALELNKNVGLFSAAFLIFNRVVGTGCVVANPWNPPRVRPDSGVEYMQHQAIFYACLAALEYP
jgi:hypothetical protein